jgi:zinc protease
VKRLFALMLLAGLVSPGLAAATTPAKPPKNMPTGVAAGPTAAPQKITSVEGITEYRLANGLRVLLFPDNSKPTITTNIVYQVGSRHENYGETGMAHLLEHLLFKPTLNFGIKKGTKTPVEVLNSVGAQFNGTTWYDRTNYFSTFPANDDNLRTMLALEADRMINSPVSQKDLWDPEAKKGEMTVVRNEFERFQSDPIAVTTSRLQAVAFDWHNYGKDAIGTRSDIEKVNVDRLRAFYKKYYQPDNAILIVAGRFDEAKVLKEIGQHFGRIPKPTRMLQSTYTSEPVQDGERAVTVRRTGGTQFVGAGYHVPSASHEDAAAIDVLNHILVSPPSGRLYKALVDAKLATRVGESSASNFEPSYQIYTAVVPKDLSLQAAEDVMVKTLEGLKTQPVTDAEVERAKTALLKSVDLVMNDTAQLSIELTEAQASGDWRLFFVRRDRLRKVDAKTVQAAADKYIKASNRTVGRFIPTDTADRADVPAAPDVNQLVATYKGDPVVAQGERFDPTPDNVEGRLQRFTLPNGMRGALLPKKTKGEQVTLDLQLRLGTEQSLRNKAMVGGFTVAQLMRGTARLSRQEIKDAFDKLKTVVSINGGAEGIGAHLVTTRANLPAALDLLAEVLKTPSFPDTEFAEYQRDRINRIVQDLPEPQPLALNALNRLLDPTPAGHVKHVLSLPEQLDAAKTVTVQNVRDFHRQFYGAQAATVAVVGDFDPADLKNRLTTLFGSWKSPEAYVRIPAQLKSVSGEKQALATPDKANSLLLAVQPMPLKDDAPEYPSLVMVDYMLGGGTLRSRLADRIRQKEGLSYGVGSRLTVPALDPAGRWFVYAISAPENTAKVEAALRDELDKVLKDGFTEAELADAKKSWLQGQEVARSDDDSLSSRLAYYLTLDRTMAFEKSLEARVKALTLAQVNESLRRTLKPGALSVITAGDFAKVKAQQP